MDAEAISKEIIQIRERLREIEAERENLAEDDLEAKTNLHDEEVELKSRLGELQDMSAMKADPAKDMAEQEKGKTKPEGFVPSA